MQRGFFWKLWPNPLEQGEVFDFEISDPKRREFQSQYFSLLKGVWFETSRVEMCELSNSSEALAEEHFESSHISTSEVSFKTNKAKPNLF